MISSSQNPSMCGRRTLNVPSLAVCSATVKGRIGRESHLPLGKCPKSHVHTDNTVWTQGAINNSNTEDMKL